MTADRWLRRYHPARPGAPRLLCLPHAGGSASFFFPASAALQPEVDVVAAQYPGRQDRRLEPGLRDLRALADQLAERLGDGTPTTVFGHSMGALVGYELAQRLGPAVTHLYVSGRRAPDGPRPGDDVHTRSDDGVLAEVTRLGGPGSELLADPELRAMAMPAIRSDYAAVETYVPAPGTPLACPVTALVGDSDPRVTLAEARAWAARTTGPFDLRVFPGGHFYLAAQLPAVLDVIRPA